MMNPYHLLTLSTKSSLPRYPSGRVIRDTQAIRRVTSGGRSCFRGLPTLGLPVDQPTHDLPDPSIDRVCTPKTRRNDFPARFIRPYSQAGNTFTNWLTD